MGNMAALRLEVPDINRLDEVPGVSHTDLYQSYPEDTTRMLTDTSLNGVINLQDLETMIQMLSLEDG